MDTLPESSTSILQPVDSMIERIVLPPEPMTSRMRSLGIWIVKMRGAKREMFGRGRLERLGHLVEDVEPADAGLLERLLEDVAAQALDLDVHLEGRDALARAGDLEVHVAVVVFLAGDVGQDREAVAVGDEAHRDARDRRLDRHARVHERERAAADGRHRGGAVGLEDVRDDAHGVREGVLARQHRRERAAGQVAVADVAARGAAHELRLAHGEGREVVVEEERVLALALVLLDDLRVVGGAERRGHEGLGLAAGEERRAVGAGEDADLGGDRADLRELAAVEALAGEDRLARQDLDEVVGGLGDLLALLGLGLGHHRRGGLLDGLDLGVGGDLVRQRHRRHHRRLPGPADLGEDARRVRLGRLPGGLLEAAAALERDLGADDLPDGLVAEEDRVDQGLLGDLAGAALDHDDGVVGAADDQVEVRLVALGVGRVEDELAVEPADADRADGRVERDGRAGQGDGGAVDREDVGVVLAVGREDEGDDLRLVVEALRKERPHGPVDQARGQDLFLGRPAFALEPAAGDPARGVGRLAVVDGQRERTRRSPSAPC